MLVPSFQGVGESRPPDLDVTAFYTGRTRAKAADLRDNGNGVAAWDVETYDPVEIRGQPTISICDEV